MTSIGEHFERHQEQAFILKIFLVIFAILFVREYLSGFLLVLIILFPVLFLAYIKIKAVANDESTFEILKEHITFMPFMYAEGERKKEGVTWVTYALILINVLIFYGIECNPAIDVKYVFDNFSFYPHHPNAWNTPVSLFSAMFLHGSGGHLWGNMIFLWTLGTVIERRIGHGRFIIYYMTTGVVASLLFAAIEFLFNGRLGHLIGASGAISGIMGVFAVRCYFKSMVFPIPILGIFYLIFPISLKIKLNSLIIIGLFFFLDLSEGIGQVSGTSHSHVGHWAHIGGMISGMGIAGFMKLGADAMEEKYLDMGRSVMDRGTGLRAAEKSLRTVLDNNPDNAEALLNLARIESDLDITDEGRHLYEKAIRALIATNPKEASRAFLEYYKKYFKGLEPNLMYRIAAVLYREGELDMSARCYEMLVNSANAPASVREQSLYRCATVLEEMGLTEAAHGYYHRFVDLHAASPAVPKIKAKLGI